MRSRDTQHTFPVSWVAVVLACLLASQWPELAGTRTSSPCLPAAGLTWTQAMLATAGVAEGSSGLVLPRERAQEGGEGATAGLAAPSPRGEQI